MTHQLAHQDALHLFTHTLNSNHIVFHAMKINHFLCQINDRKILTPKYIQFNVFISYNDVCHLIYIFDVDNTVCIAEMSKLHTVQSGFAIVFVLYSEMFCDEKKAEQSDPHKQLLEHGFVSYLIVVVELKRTVKCKEQFIFPHTPSLALGWSSKITG